MRTSPGKGKRPMLMAHTLKVRPYSTIFHYILGRIDSRVFDIFAVMLDSLNWRTSHTTYRSLSFILFPKMSTVRPTIFHGGST